MELEGRLEYPGIANMINMMPVTIPAANEVSCGVSCAVSAVSMKSEAKAVSSPPRLPRGLQELSTVFHRLLRPGLILRILLTSPRVRHRGLKEAGVHTEVRRWRRRGGGLILMGWLPQGRVRGCNAREAHWGLWGRWVGIL
jgi:hypothetical protein